MNLRGQAAIEFLLLFGFMIVVFTVFMVLIQQRTTLREEEGDAKELARIGQAIAAEVQLAARVHDGYERTFRLPLSVSRGTYTITLAPTVTPSEITISDGQDAYVVFLPINLTTGSVIKPGSNSITRQNGTATITPLTAESAPADTCACEQPDDSCASVGQSHQGNACRVCALTGWSNAVDGASCDDGLACNGVDTCHSGLCVAGAVIACDETTPYCIEPDAICVACTLDTHCESSCVVNVKKTGVDILFYPASVCTGNACVVVKAETCYSDAFEPADSTAWCHGYGDKEPAGCCGSSPDFLCPPVIG